MGSALPERESVNPVFFWVLWAAIFYASLILTGATSSPITWLELLSPVGWSLWLSWGTEYAIRFLFPSGVFLIGQEKAQYKTKERLQWLVIFTVTAAILTGVGFLAAR